MKKYIFVILILPFLFSCGSDEITDDNYTDLIDMEKSPVITFDEPVFNFGNIIEGAVVKNRFTFTNTGKAPLIISSISASCGCTATDNWSRDPIKPGEKGFVDATFKSEGFPGSTDKKLTVVSNTFPTNTIIKIKGTVIGPDFK